MTEITPHVRIYKMSDKDEPVIITDNNNAILFDRGGAHAEPRQALLRFPRTHDDNAVYEPGLHIYKWNIAPKIAGEPTPHLTQQFPKPDSSGEGLPSIISVTVIGRAKYDEVAGKYLRQMSEYVQRVSDAQQGPSQQILAVQQGAERKIQQLLQEMEAATAKIIIPTFNLESLLR